ncbi:hypothetical protein DPM19_34375 [Actinomadura craniellae]|uniref:Uncharacterized protein n=1 Tax=Actinomadura craniellae TaxID=2231787 RepID=A0A365GV31_9ACTN|nr:hypothetical protein [Actinomadura craniellae]RAY10648.1 hypothetical protein DPM19_34375 [Actinomadura craniellae]
MQTFTDDGPLPDEDADVEEIQRREDQLRAIQAPGTSEEAELLALCFGPDDLYFMAWTLLHLIESAPCHPVDCEPSQEANPWLHHLWQRRQQAL